MFRRFLSILFSIPFLLHNISLSSAQSLAVNNYSPVILKGLSLNPDNPFFISFTVDSGRPDLPTEELNSETMKLVKYFMSALTIPENDVWVNLSPIEQDRVVPENLGHTLMGRDMLAQDLVLKRLTGKMLSADTDIGRVFWEKVYEKAYTREVSTADLQTFSKVWIVPDYADIYQEGYSAYLGDFRLKVMLDEDHALNAGKNIRHDLKDVMRSEIIPLLEEEINSGTSFAVLRQIFSAMLLAVWFKSNLKESVWGTSYFDKNILGGIDQIKIQDIQNIYQEYSDIFKQNLNQSIMESYDPSTQTIVSKQFLSGGILTARPEHLRKHSVFKASVSFLGNPHRADIQFVNKAMMAKNTDRQESYENWPKITRLKEASIGQWVFFDNGHLKHVVEVVGVNKDGFTINVDPYSNAKPYQIEITSKNFKDFSIYQIPKGVILKRGIESRGLLHAMRIWENYRDEFYALRDRGLDITKASIPFVGEKYFSAIRTLYKFGYVEAEYVSMIGGLTEKIKNIRRISSIKPIEQTVEFLEALDWLQKRMWDEYFSVYAIFADALKANEFALIRSGWFIKGNEFKNRVIEFRNEWKKYLEDVPFYEDLLKEDEKTYRSWVRGRTVKTVITNMNGIIHDPEGIFEEDVKHSIFNLQKWMRKDKNHSLFILTGSNIGDAINATTSFKGSFMPQIFFFILMGLQVFHFGAETSVLALSSTLSGKDREVVTGILKQYFNTVVSGVFETSYYFSPDEFKRIVKVKKKIKADLKRLGLENSVYINLSERRLVVNSTNKLKSLQTYMAQHPELKWDEILIFGSSSLDVQVLNYVAQKGGIAVWLGKNSSLALKEFKLDPKVKIAPHTKTHGFLRTIHALNQEADAAMLKDVGGIDLKGSLSSLRVKGTQLKEQLLSTNVIQLEGLTPVLQSLSPLDPAYFSELAISNN